MEISSSSFASKGFNLQFMGTDSQSGFPASPQTAAKIKAKLSNIDERSRMNATQINSMTPLEL